MENQQELSETIEEIEAPEPIEETLEEKETEWEKLQSLINQNHQQTMERLNQLEQKQTVAETTLPQTAETAEMIAEIPPIMEAEISNSSTVKKNQQKEGVVDHEKTATRKQSRLARKANRNKK